MGTVEDFFNFDLLGAGSSSSTLNSSTNVSGGSSSRSSSHSPQPNIWNLPPTPKMVTSDVGIITDDPLFQSLYATQPVEKIQGQEELYTFNDTTTSFSPSAFTNLQSFEQPMLAIDPQLTAHSPTNGDDSSTSELRPANSSYGDDEELDTIEEEDEEESSPQSATSPTSPKAVYKVGGKGKSNRKGTVASGGIRKSNNSVPMTQAVRRAGEPEDEDDWRPTAEEYKKMSSKEKRQLRNKISARNFRVRRKEYITTLEGDIAQRDSLIDVIRTELSSTKMENQSLRGEVEALKKALLKGGIKPNLPPPAPLSETTPLAAMKDNKPDNKRKKSGSPLPTHNTQKDLPLSPRMGGNAFWGGRSALGAGITPVHTTLIPDFSPFIPDKLAARARAQSQTPVQAPPSQQENINPNLNSNPFFGIGHLKNDMNFNVNNKGGAFEGYTDSNAFNFRNMDNYRMHLWQKMGNRPITHPVHGNSFAPGTGNGFHPTYMQNPLVSNMRPSYFASPNSKTLNDSTNTHSLPSKDVHTPQQAVIASLVSQSFMSKLSGAFWDAFTSPAIPNAVGNSKKDWDAEKVRKVIEGKAVLKVVDLPTTQQRENSGIEALEKSLKDLAIGSHKAASGSSLASGSASPPKEKMILRPEPCFLAGLRSGTSPLCSNNVKKSQPQK